MSRLICLITTSLLFLSSLILATAIFAIVLLQKPRTKNAKTQSIHFTTKIYHQKERERKKEAPFGGLEAIAEEGDTHLEGLLAVSGSGASHSHLFAFFYWILSTAPKQGEQKEERNSAQRSNRKRNYLFLIIHILMTWRFLTGPSFGNSLSAEVFLENNFLGERAVVLRLES